MSATGVTAQPDGGVSPHPFGTPTVDNRAPSAAIDAVPASRPSSSYIDGTRSEVVARNGVASTSQPLATAAANEILQAGGNAIDAAVAASAVLGVTEPGSTGLGGDMFAIVWSARDKQLYAHEASGWAPEAWSVDYFRDLGLNSVPGNGINSAVVPGAVSGWAAMLDRFGSMGFDEVLEPAATYAEKGFGVHERASWSSQAKLRNDPDSAEVWLPEDGEPPLMYSIFRNPGMADALRLIQREGRDAFYEGPIAEAIVAKSQEAGGAMTLEDLAEYESSWVDTLSTTYKGYEVHQLPPPNQGFAALQMLNLLEECVPYHGASLHDLGPRDPQYWHYMLETKKLAYSDLYRYNADPLFESVPTDRLLDKDYAASLCDEIDPDQARPAQNTGNQDGGTVYFATADRWGNMVSFVHSIFSEHGSGVTIPPYGFILANRGSGFTLDEDHPNVVEGRKRPFITIMSGFITKDDQPLMAFGNMGGATQPHAHVQHTVNMIDLGMNVQVTTDVARFDHNQNSDVASLDTYLYDLVGEALEDKGHQISRSRGHAGGYQGILFERDPDLPEPNIPPRRGREIIHTPRFQQPLNGVYRAGADPRKDGHAAGW